MDSKNVNSKRWKGLVDAAKHDDEEAVKYWVEKACVPVTRRNVKKQTAAHFAVENNNLSILKYLLNHDSKNSLIRMRDADGFTVFHASVMRGTINIVRYLLDELPAGSINTFEPLKDHPMNNVVHLAAESGQLEVLKYIIEEKRGDVNVLNKFRESPVFLAVEEQHFDVVRYLVEESEANIFLTDWNRNNILHRASYKGDLNVTKYLLDNKKMAFEINARNDRGETYVHLAARFNHLQIVKYLVEEKKADVNIPDITRRTALYEAAFFGYFDVVKYLVEQGADMEVEDVYGRRPLEAAVGNELKKYLRAKSRKRNRRDVTRVEHAFSKRETKLWMQYANRTPLSIGREDHLGSRLSALHSNNNFLGFANACVEYVMGLNHT